MSSTTHTMAGLLAHAGAARLEAVSGHEARCATPLLATTGALATQGAYGHHQSASWTVGAIAKPATFMVFDRKNRPTRPLSEHSP
jgi:hypothetical protein